MSVIYKLISSNFSLFHSVRCISTCQTLSTLQKSHRKFITKADLKCKTSGQVTPLYSYNHEAPMLHCWRFLSTHQTLKNIQRAPKELISKAELKMRSIDKVPPSYILVYKAPMENYVYCAHIASICSMIGAGVLSLIDKYVNSNVREVTLADLFTTELSAELSDLQVGVFVAGFIALNAGLWLASSRYALRIYSNGEKKPRYHCVMLAKLIPLKKRMFEFGLADMKLDTGLVSKFPWGYNCYKVRSEKMFILHDYFRTPADLNNMLGLGIKPSKK